MKILIVLLLSLSCFAKTVTNVTFNFNVNDIYAKNSNEYSGNKSNIKSNLFYIVERNSEFVFNYSDNQFESNTDNLSYGLEIKSNVIKLSRNGEIENLKIKNLKNGSFHLSIKDSKKLLEQRLKNKSLNALYRLGFNLDQDLIKSKIKVSKYKCNQRALSLICEFSAKVKLEITGSDL